MFHFVPRKVAQKAATRNPIASPSAVAHPPPVPGPSSTHVRAPSPEPGHETTDAKGSSKTSATSVNEEHLAALTWLSLSEHRLWLDVDLRRTVTAADEGWIPLSYLYHHSPYFLHFKSRPSESVLVKAIRTHAEELLEVRMLVTAPPKGAWYSKHSSKDELGGYEIRRLDWADALARVRSTTRNEWEARTIYAESVPIPCRTVAGIHHFTSALLGLSNSSSLTPRIQSITLPPHHLDRPGDAPKCKGFALVTFLNTDDATKLVADWPWHPRRTSAQLDGTDEASVAQQAVKFGFRTLSKARWDELKEEYLTYRQHLLDEMGEADHRGMIPGRDGGAEPSTLAQAKPADEGDSRAEGGRTSTTRPRSALNPSASFPPGCLVYVRNVHPETNKTTLKALFTSHAFPSATSPALDYVDYNKGMTSCHLRLSTPHHAQTFLAAISSRPLVQRQGLDNASAGSPPSDSDQSHGSKPISAELVDGEREALYWDKVPEKVRREAVKRAIALSSSSSISSAEGEVAANARDEDSGRHQGKRPRKRRRKA